VIGGITRASIRLRPASRPPRVRPASLARGRSPQAGYWPAQPHTPASLPL